MCFYPTALLASLLLAFLAGDLQNAKASDKQLQAFNQSTSSMQLVGSNTHPFHRGSGRLQRLYKATSHA
ncbi:hypothetical protein H6F76_23830 [Leptolyngbya sp. FACHB-321]|uniref:hypothetical protein n=1 Tax=Leptolyngbya sp. FACHB-321 TaxID=2692807 RepID=UPI0016891070|nr:hypothetical protein [Leptolyngbya sp. FACHB-321]MBD2037984.1 hypothetical protein [Leptolyngbya sp. FACHB-321]